MVDNAELKAEDNDEYVTAATVREMLKSEVSRQVKQGMETARTEIEASVKRDLERSRQEWSEQFSALDRRLGEVVSLIQGVQTTFASITVETAKMTGAVTAYSEQLKAMDTRISNNFRNMDALRGNISDAYSQLAGIRSDLYGDPTKPDDNPSVFKLLKQVMEKIDLHRQELGVQQAVAVAGMAERIQPLEDYVSIELARKRKRLAFRQFLVRMPPAAAGMIPARVWLLLGGTGLGAAVKRLIDTIFGEN